MTLVWCAAAPSHVLMTPRRRPSARRPTEADGDAMEIDADRARAARAARRPGAWHHLY